MLSASAPGKLVLLGEYAVLEGAPALVQAIDRRAVVSVVERAAERASFHAIPLLPQAIEFEWTADGGVRFTDEDAGRSLTHAARLLAAFGPWTENGSPVAISADTRRFFAAAGYKLGIGSSAALSVALAAAWFACRHPGSPFDPGRWLGVLRELHRSAQGGQGSGIDLAASLYGGVIRYNLVEESPQINRLSLPAALSWVWIGLGRAASTGDFLRAARRLKESDCAVYDNHIRHLGEIAATGCAAAEENDAAGLLAALQAYGGALERFGLAAEAPIYTADHRRLAQIAGRYPVAFKPSGAGGGDIALAAAADPEALAAFARDVHGAGYPLLPLAPAADGVTVALAVNEPT